MKPERPQWPLLAIALVLRSVRLNGPVVGVHSWRQADTAAMARHFAEGGMHWWLPQIDWGGATAGYVEAEFPLYPWLVAWLYRLGGIHEWLGRSLSVVCSLLTLLLVVRIGRRLLGSEAGWWGGLLWAVAPLAVHYGRAVQAESLLMLLAAFGLDRGLAWRSTGRERDLALAWLMLTLCGLLKVLPLLWLGLPLLWLWLQRHGIRGLRLPVLWLMGFGSLICVAAWYVHAHHLGAVSGLSFGFWMSDTNRYSWQQLLGLDYWLNIGLRFSLRGLGLVGLPLVLAAVVTVLRRRDADRAGTPGSEPPTAEARVLVVGMAAVLLAGALAAESSSVHEYYQLPLLLYAAPLLGLGLDRLAGHPQWRRMAMAGIVAAAMLSLIADYWLVERRQEAVLLPLARAIEAGTTPQQRVISVTGPDPTLLNLARRQGWLIKPGKLTTERIQSLQAEGADVIAASFETIESYRPFSDGPQKQQLINLLCGHHASSPDIKIGSCAPDKPYAVVPIPDNPDELRRRFHP